MPKRVLVVDDDEDILELISLALSQEQYEVVAAPHGGVALDMARERPPDVILLDMKMPVMDGWEFVRQYRQLPGTRAPVVVMTAATDAGGRAGEVQAEGHLEKPFDLEQLLKIVKRLAGP